MMPMRGIGNKVSKHMIPDLKYRLQCETCGVIKSDEGPDGLFTLRDAMHRAEAHKEVRGPGHGGALLAEFAPQPHQPLPNSRSPYQTENVENSADST